MADEEDQFKILQDSIRELRFEVAVAVWVLLEPAFVRLGIIRLTKRDKAVRGIVSNTKRLVEAKTELYRLERIVARIDAAIADANEGHNGNT